MIGKVKLTRAGGYDPDARPLTRDELMVISRRRDMRGVSAGETRRLIITALAALDIERPQCGWCPSYLTREPDGWVCWSCDGRLAEQQSRSE